MIIFLQELVLQLFLWSLKLIDSIFDIFASLTGINTVLFNGEQHNIIELCMSDSTVSTIFWCVFILAIGLSCIFTIVSIVKNMAVPNKDISSVIGKFFLSILGTLAMTALVVLLILISNSILYLVADIFKIGTDVKLSTAIFNACVGDYINGYSISEIDLDALSVSEIFGDYETVALGIWPKSWKRNGMVDPTSFMYVSCIIASICLPLAVVLAALTLTKRIFEMVYLYVVMPISLSTISLDDGERFKSWRECFLSKILIGYGTVFSVNVFILLTPILTQIRVESLDSFGNTLLTILILIGGALVIPAGQELFVHLFAVGGNVERVRFNERYARGFIHGATSTMLMPVHLVGGLIGSTRARAAARSADIEKDMQEIEKDQKYAASHGEHFDTPARYKPSHHLKETQRREEKAKKKESKK